MPARALTGCAAMTLAVFAAAHTAAQSQPAATGQTFNRDVLPILQKNCH